MRGGPIRFDSRQGGTVIGKRTKRRFFVMSAPYRPIGIRGFPSHDCPWFGRPFRSCEARHTRLYVFLAAYRRTHRPPSDETVNKHFNVSIRMQSYGLCWTSPPESFINSARTRSNALFDRRSMCSRIWAAAATDMQEGLTFMWPQICCPQEYNQNSMMGRKT